jgi:hypothetical protein
LAKGRAKQHGTNRVEADKPCIEGRVPIRGEKKAVMDVETFGVVFALGPGLM